MTGVAPPISGVIASCLTPFDDQGGVAIGPLGREIDDIIDECHADAVAIAATEDSEYPLLELSERKDLMAAGTQLVNHRIPVILGISHPAPERAIELAEHAKAVGGDVALLLLPIRLWGGDPNADEIYDYVDEIARNSPLPICCYQNRRTGSDPAIATFLRLADVPNVGYIAEMSGDLTRISRLVEEIERRGSAGYFTTIESLLINLSLGGSGAVMPPPAARVGAEVVRAFRAGDMDRAVEWQRILGLFPGRWSRYGLPPVMKAAMRHLGIDLGAPADPWGKITDADVVAIGELLEVVGLKEPREDVPTLPTRAAGPVNLRTTLPETASGSGEAR
jgi:4-hydroxy-tetrahydrodipicolinate synthase